MPEIDIVLEKLKGIEKLFNERFDENASQHKRLFSLLDKKADKTELEKKADKLVEKIVYGGVKLALFAIFGALIGLVVVKPQLAVNLLHKISEYV